MVGLVALCAGRALPKFSDPARRVIDGFRPDVTVGRAAMSRGTVLLMAALRACRRW